MMPVKFLALVHLVLLLNIKITFGFEETFTVQGDAIKGDLRLSPKTLINRMPRETNQGLDTDADIGVREDNHTYYKWRLFNPENFDDYWIELKDDSKHHFLSNSYDMANSANLSFDFLFFGHELHRVALTTAGFISTSTMLHTKMFHTQYIAPYMAGFNPSLRDNSTVYFEIMSDKFVVEWRDVFAMGSGHHHRYDDSNLVGPFSFQTVIHKNGSIVFAYKKMPGIYRGITVGLVEAAFFETKHPNMYLYMNYGQVQIDSTTIREGTVILLTPKPTCNLAKDCETCVTEDIGFDCKWCSALDRCSDGIDRGTQDWHLSGCYHNSTSTCNDRDTTNGNITKETATNITSVHASTGRSTSRTTTSAAAISAKEMHVSSRKTTKKTTTRATTISEQNMHDSISKSTTKKTTASPTTVFKQEVHDSVTGSTKIVTTGADVVSTTARNDFSSRSTSTVKTGMNDNDDKRSTAGYMPSTSDSNNLGIGRISNLRGSKTNPEDAKKNPASSNTGLVVVLVLIIVAVLASVCGLFCYAYTHPSSRPAIWLLEHRPSNMIVRWKSRKDPGPTETTPVSKA